MHHEYSSLQNILQDLADIGVDSILSDNVGQDYHTFAPAMPNYNIMRLIELVGGDVPERERVLNQFKLYIPNDFRPSSVSIAPQIQTQQTITPKLGNKPYHNIVRPVAVQSDNLVEETDITDIVKCAFDVSQSARDIYALKNALLGFKTGIELQELARQTVFFDGNPASDIMIIGDYPEIDDNITGIPFSGKAGEILNRALEALEFSRDYTQTNKAVCMMNMIFWRSAHRKPTLSDYKVCLPFVKRAIELVNPKKIILMGVVGLELLLDVKSSLMMARGQRYDYVMNNISYPVYVTFPPYSLLQMPLAKKEFWFDIMKALLTP